MDAMKNFMTRNFRLGMKTMPTETIDHKGNVYKAVTSPVSKTGAYSDGGYSLDANIQMTLASDDLAEEISDGDVILYGGQKYRVQSATTACGLTDIYLEDYDAQ